MSMKIHKLIYMYVNEIHKLIYMYVNEIHKLIYMYVNENPQTYIHECQ